MREWAGLALHDHRLVVPNAYAVVPRLSGRSCVTGGATQLGALDVPGWLGASVRTEHHLALPEGVARWWLDE